MLSQKIKSKKVELSLDQKREICNFFNNNTSIKQTQLILKFNNKFNMLISKSTMSDLIRNRKKYTATENIRPIGTKFIYYKNIISKYIEQKNSLLDNDLSNFIHLSNILKFSKIENKQTSLEIFLN